MTKSFLTEFEERLATLAKREPAPLPPPLTEHVVLRPPMEDLSAPPDPPVRIAMYMKTSTYNKLSALVHASKLVHAGLDLRAAQAQRRALLQRRAASCQYSEDIWRNALPEGKQAVEDIVQWMQVNKQNIFPTAQLTLRFHAWLKGEDLPPARPIKAKPLTYAMGDIVAELLDKESL